MPLTVTASSVGGRLGQTLGKNSADGGLDNRNSLLRHAPVKHRPRLVVRHRSAVAAAKVAKFCCFSAQNADRPPNRRASVCGSKPHTGHPTVDGRLLYRRWILGRAISPRYFLSITTKRLPCGVRTSMSTPSSFGCDSNAFLKPSTSVTFSLPTRRISIPSRMPAV